MLASYIITVKLQSQEIGINKILLTTILENLHDEKKFTIYLYFLFLINDPEGNLVFYLSH